MISVDGQDNHVSTCRLDISGDGYRIASLTIFEETIQLNIWDASTGSCVSRLRDPGRLQPDTCIAFLSNGPDLLFWSKDGIFYRWNSVTGDMLSSYELPAGPRARISVSRCGSQIAISSQGTVNVWKMNEENNVTDLQKPLFSLSRDEAQTLHSVSLIKLDNQRLFLFECEAIVLLGKRASPHATIWDIQTGLKIFSMRFDGRARVVAICGEIKRMAIIIEGSMQIWDIESGTLLGQLAGNAAAFSPTEMVAASVAHSGVLGTWDIGAMQLGSNSNTSDTASHPCTSVSASRSGRDVISAYSQSKAVLIWNMFERTCLKLNVPDLRHPVVMSPDGLYFVCGTHDGNSPDGWSLYETKSQQLLYHWRDPDCTTPRQSPTFSEDSTRIAVQLSLSFTGFDKVIRVLDIRSGRQLCEIKGDGTVFFLDGLSLLVAHRTGYEIFKLSSGIYIKFLSTFFKWGPDVKLGGNPHTRRNHPWHGPNAYYPPF